MYIVLIDTPNGIKFYNGYPLLSMWADNEFHANRMVLSVAQKIAGKYPGAEIHKVS